jgi:hypothetical protein
MTSKFLALAYIGTSLIVVFADEEPIWNRPEFKALSMVESGNNDNAIGRKGERGRYQMRKAAWKESSLVPHSYASNIKFSSEATQNYMMLQSNMFLQHTHRLPTDYDLYVMWNMGFTGYKRKQFEFNKCPKRVKENAQRFYDLLYLYKSKN